MKLLPLTFKKYGHRFVLLRRCENKALYVQYIGNTLIAYEVIKIRKRLQRYNRLLKQEDPAQEIYPSKEQWGSKAWTCKIWEKALAKYNSI